MLEEYVSQQVRDGTYDLDANMALLKLYQFYPDRVRNEVRYFLCHIKGLSALKFLLLSFQPKFKIYFTQKYGKIDYATLRAFKSRTNEEVIFLFI